ncbi:hypothetical protein GGE45_006500 [Rhizobium aethiopicum]|uniref:Uncharacterized protein n=1 Tax=Rhizobium aethiopicum TaxID=1138170 RepID=A0A7W6QE04_9HYPH|nr:hypothetical protein [Rhizobium aethiopicum]MBB4195816.1 hypothetical protein [Rhizobium aethiopicum]MBB4584111.1 hypothetical protein [Rhizobium aethiopicum]
MSKTNVRELQKRAEQQVKNTSAGGHLGGTYSASNQTEKQRRTPPTTAPRQGRTMGAIEAGRLSYRVCGDRILRKGALWDTSAARPFLPPCLTFGKSTSVSQRL